MDRFARVVLGYLDGTVPVDQWRPSTNVFDWLGQGIYFWEHAPERARAWAGADGGVIGAIIQLGRCFDLTNPRYTQLLRESFDEVVEIYKDKGLPMPKNEGRDLKLRKLDCLVINHFMSETDRASAGGGGEAFRFQTIRCPFEEGDEAFCGSMLKTQTHIQVAVRDPSCILGIFRPNI
jgi:hypothetical protein